MRVTLTLGFAGRLEEALNFYRDAVGAETQFFMRMRDCPDPSLVRPGTEDQVFHATFRIGETEIMASDVGGGPTGGPAFAGFALAVRADGVAHAGRMFDALSAGGTVLVPLAAASFTAHYGIVVDRFGLTWKITVE